MLEFGVRASHALRLPDRITVAAKTRFFVASVATETNTFSPVYTDLDSFRASFYYPPGEHPGHPSLCSGPHIGLRELAEREPIEVIEGTATWADPSGMVQQATHERLRDTVLAELDACMPVDAVLLGLHGAMVAQQCDDCEGELIEMVRKRIGPGVFLGVSFDPHSHLTARRTKHADIVVAFKEFPHVDCTDRGRELAALALRTVRGDIKPVIAVHDCRMIDTMPTTQEPMRSFVDRLRQIEREDGKVLDISVIHGFKAANVADLGAKIVVVAHDDIAYARQLAAKLGKELFALRGQTGINFLTPEKALRAAAEADGGPVVLADVHDNPGGGTTGDDTRFLRMLVERGERGAALAPLWDPQAVRMCFAAGEGARIALRIGAKHGPGFGEPLDALVHVKKLDECATQTFAGFGVRMGRTAMVAIGEVEVVLTTGRAQAFGTDLFSNMGINPAERRILVVKSTNHFRASFAKLTDRIYYCDTGTDAACPRSLHDPRYSKLKRKLWPLHEDPHGDG